MGPADLVEKRLAADSFYGKEGMEFQKTW